MELFLRKSRAVLKFPCLKFGFNFVNLDNFLLRNSLLYSYSGDRSLLSQLAEFFRPERDSSEPGDLCDADVVMTQPIEYCTGIVAADSKLLLTFQLSRAPVPLIYDFKALNCQKIFNVMGYEYLSLLLLSVAIVGSDPEIPFRPGKFKPSFRHSKGSAHNCDGHVFSCFTLQLKYEFH